MSSFLPVSGRPPHPSSSSDSDKLDDRETDTLPTVTTHLHLKPAHSTQTLDKDVVLRRIRRRKHLNKVRNLFQALLSFPSPAADSGFLHDNKKWVDDNFAAP